ncbi:hypothetical protein JST97_38515 [bacterium]|nr:hypothetical protein [bacterium]
MQVHSIPAYIDTKNLTITRQCQVQNNPLHTEIEATDPQGDSLTISRQQSPSGPACVMPRVEMTVCYHQADAEAEKPHGIGSDEAGDLYLALKRAKKSDDLDSLAGMWILSDLAQKGGIGGAC